MSQYYNPPYHSSGGPRGRSFYSYQNQYQDGQWQVVNNSDPYNGYGNQQDWNDDVTIIQPTNCDVNYLQQPYQQINNYSGSQRRYFNRRVGYIYNKSNNENSYRSQPYAKALEPTKPCQPVKEKEKFRTLNQYVEIEGHNWQSKHAIQDVWLSKSSKDTDIDELPPNAVATKCSSSTNSNARVIPSSIFNAQKEKNCTQNNLHNKENTSTNSGVHPHNETENILKNQNVPMVSDPCATVPKLVLRKKSTAWSVESSVGPDVGGLVLSDSSGSENLNPAPSPTMLANGQRQLSPTLITNSTDVIASNSRVCVHNQDPVEKQTNNINNVVIASSLYALDNGLKHVSPSTSRPEILDTSSSCAIPVPSSCCKDVCNFVPRKSTSALATSGCKPGPLSTKSAVRCQNEKQDESTSNSVVSYSNDILVPSTCSRDIFNPSPVKLIPEEISSRCKPGPLSSKSSTSSKEDVEFELSGEEIINKPGSVEETISLDAPLVPDSDKNLESVNDDANSSTSGNSDSSLSENSDSSLSENSDSSLSEDSDSSISEDSDSSSDDDPNSKSSNDSDVEITGYLDKNFVIIDLTECDKNNGGLSPSSENSSSPLKRKIQGDERMTSSPKIQKIISQNSKNTYRVDEETIEISSDEEIQETADSPTALNSSLHFSTSPTKRRYENEAFADAINSNPQKMENEKNYHRTQSNHQRSTSIKNATKTTSVIAREKMEQTTPSFMRNSATIERPIKKLPSQQVVEQRNNKKLMVTLERLTPAVIAEFSKSSKSTLNKVTLTYERDTLNQVKYFICSIRYLSIQAGFSISLSEKVCDPKDLCDKVIHAQKQEENNLLQVKYFQNSHQTINYKSLSNSAFDIKNIYKNFLEHRRTSGKLDSFIILTNYKISFEAFKKNGVSIEPIPFGHITHYQFNVKQGHELHKKFLKCLILPDIAEVLAQCFKDGKQKNFNSGLIKKYHLALVKENVLMVDTRKSSNGKVQIRARFHPDFLNLNRISKAAKELRYHLSKKLQSGKPWKSMEFTITNEGFGKEIILDPNPELDIIKVAEALVCQQRHKLSSVKDDLKKIVGHVLEKQESHLFCFRREFFTGDNIPRNLKQLRMQVKTLLQHMGKDFFQFIQGTISIKDFCNDLPGTKLPEEDSEQLFKEFFKCFAISNVQDWAHVLDEDISNINDERCMNAVQEELLGRIQSQNLNEDGWLSMKNLISKYKITIPQELQPKIKVDFNPKTLNALARRIPEHDIVLYLTSCPVLTNLVINQLCTNVLKLREGKETIHITNKALLEMTSDVIKALAHRSINLLVVHWSEAVQDNQRVSNVFTELMYLVKDQANSSRLSMKSVIVIGEKKSCSFLKNIIAESIEDDKYSFDLSEDSKTKLLETKNIHLGDKKLSLKPDLIEDKHLSVLLQSTEILYRLLNGKLSIDQSFVKPSGYTACHFKTQITQCIIINPAIFHDRIEDIFIFHNIERKDLENYLPARQRLLTPNDVPSSMRIGARFILLGSNTEVSFFDKYAEKNQEHSVHLLDYESGNFIWEKTIGNNKDLLKHREDCNRELLKTRKIDKPIANIVESGPKTTIICGESGLGKSSCLYNLARQTKRLYLTGSTNDAYWTVQVNLDKSRLSKFVKLDSDVPLERDFVQKFLSEYLDLDEVTRRLLKMVLQNQLKIKLALFFDNYEELPASHRNFVIKLLQELQVSYCERIYVTSTPNTRSQLENALAVFAYTLEFSEPEVVVFLQSFWSRSQGEVDLSNEASNLYNNYRMLISTPLHLKMLAELYKLREGDNYPSIKTLGELYKLYVEHKGVEDEESASLYSLHKILDADQQKSLGIRHKYPKNKRFTLPGDLGHRTFYEYFAAKWLATRNDSLVVTQCINDLLDTVSPLFFKVYLTQSKFHDAMVKVVSEFAANGHLNIVKAMLPHCDAKLQLSTVIQSDNPNARQVVRFLLDQYNDKGEIMVHGQLKKSEYAQSDVVRYVSRKEKSKKETPLEVAARVKNIPIACELLLKGASISGIDKEFVAEIARYIADQMCSSDDDSAWLHPIAEKLFKLHPAAVTRLDKTKEYPRLLSYFFIHGRVELINLLLKNERERYVIFEAKVNDKTPLDLVNQSRYLTDNERLEITKYIISNIGEDLERKNKYYLANVLRTAAEYNHERTFEYFVGKYPKGHMGFLESAMRCNRLDLIRFLMRKTDRMMYLEDNTALHRAVALGVSPITINFLVNRGGIDNRNKAGETPLCVAFKEGQDLQLIEYLIKKDADLFAKDNLGLYPWCHAILDESKYSAEEQTSIMKYLEKYTLRAPETEQKISFESDLKRKEIAKKLKFFQKTESFMLANLELHMALKSNDENRIRFLVQQGANVNHKEADGRTPLHVAVEFKRYKLAKMLLDHGAIFNAKDKNKCTPLKLLSSNGDDSEECKEMERLLESATELFNENEKYSASTPRHLLNCRDTNGQTLLHIAAKSGNKYVIREIIKHSKDHCIDNTNFPSLDVNAQDAKGKTPLNVVKSSDAAKELLVNGAIFEPATTPLLQSAEKLIQAVKDKDVEKVKELIKNDCLVNARDESGKSCLHWAASYDSREIVQLLLATRTTDVDVTDLELRTPLHYAAQNDNIASVSLLLKAGASYDFKDKQGLRSFDAYGKTNESLNLLRKIHEMFVDIKSDEPRIFVNDNPDALVEYLTMISATWNIPRDIVVNVVDSKKNTLLHIATKYDFCYVVENLLKQGAIYNARNKWKKTPESMAISTKQLFENVSKAQHQLNVNSWENMDPELIVNFRFNNGYTLLHSCVAKGKKEEVRWLLENGADVKATTNKGSKINCDKKKFPLIFELLEEL